MAREMGSASCVAAAPASTRTSSISSVAYAVDEIGSDENTASATRLRMCSSDAWEVASGGPRTARLAR
jgi:hypothetical protein